ncbi:MAG: cytidylate kinase-like family protein [Candidatus Omnitrophota bacterium]|nr:cytidylate kinase-like family protein [Candidatus Omnitrophota bacterium]
MADSLDAYKSYIECQIESAEKDAAESGKAAADRAFITVSRETGAGGITIGKKLEDYLNEHNRKGSCPWTVFDRNLIDLVLKEHNLSEEIEKFMPEKKKSEVEDIVETLFDLHPPEFALVRRTSETILHLAQMGHAIIVGRGANVITRKLKAGIHVRLISSKETKIRHIEEYFELSRDDAEKKVEAEDRGRRDYMRQNFGKDISDPLLYDLVINTDSVPYDAVAKIIGDAALNKCERLHKGAPEAR